jgi:putative transmembrane protein PGPGW
MDFVRRNAKRIATDAAGYLLILAALATGWLPGPGGIPLALAGLGLLSINNTWAKRLRDWFLHHGGKIVQILFPRNPWFEWGYDAVVVVLLGLTAVLALHHASVIETGLSVTAFFLALFIALTNRDRLNRLRGKPKP